jgi:hypothetical protein
VRYLCEGKKVSNLEGDWVTSQPQTSSKGVLGCAVNGKESLEKRKGLFTDLFT